MTLPGTAILTPAATPGTARRRVRVLVVDDSVVIRHLLTKMLNADPGVEVVGTARDGLDALSKLELYLPDLVTLDVEMPELDGLGALRRIKERHPEVRVIMCSSLTQRGKTVTIDALLAGADDYVTKQDSAELSASSFDSLSIDLTSKIHALFPAASTSAVGAASRKLPPPPPPGAGRPALVRRPHPFHQTPRIFAIGISTGGPAALAELLPMLPPDFHLPIVIVQHMPPYFTTLLAERLTALSRIPVYEGKQGMEVKPGCAYLAPGNYHMRLVRRAGVVEIELNQEEYENSCRPSVDVLFRSIAEIYGGGVIAAVLTGMGQDGLAGVRLLGGLGARVLAQDAATSVVWGMPGAVVEASLADAVLPLKEIVPEVLSRV